MQLFIILQLAAIAACFSIPDGQPDGVYKVTTSTAGSETHELVKLHDRSEPAATPRSLIPSAKFPKRQISNAVNGITCGGYNLFPDETDTAVRELQAQCGTGADVWPNMDFYSISGRTVAYFCNYDNNSGTKCYADEARYVFAALTNRCGSYGAGWDQFYGDRLGQYGYENIYNQGSDFCGRGTEGNHLAIGNGR